MNDNTAQMNNNFSDLTQAPQAHQATQPPDSYVNDYQPPLEQPLKSDSPEPVISSSSSSTASVNTSEEESLEAQNIFFMLGVEDGNEELRDSFLNELQDVIWDDFLENDVDLLITSDEKVKFDSLIEKKAKVTDKNTEEEVQDALVAYLETLIPDLEDIMLEKALDLKSDLFIERIAGMREYHANDQDALKLILDAEKMMHQDKWHSSAQLLNKLSS